MADFSMNECDLLFKTVHYAEGMRDGDFSWLDKECDFKSEGDMLAMVLACGNAVFPPKALSKARDLALKHIRHMEETEGVYPMEVGYFTNLPKGYTKIAEFLTDATGIEFVYEADRVRTCTSTDVEFLRKIWNQNVPQKLGTVDFDTACLAMVGRVDSVLPCFMKQMRIFRKEKKRTLIAPAHQPLLPQQRDTEKALKTMTAFYGMERRGLRTIVESDTEDDEGAFMTDLKDIDDKGKEEIE